MQVVVLQRFGGVDAFAVEDRPIPRPGPDEILIRVKAIGFNPVDVKFRRGELGGSPPMVLGRDVSGVVDAVGDQVDGFAIGDPVYARVNGAYAEWVTIPATMAARAPAKLSFAEAAAIPVAGLTAYSAVVNKARVRSGDAVLIAGAAGAVGSMAVQLARRCGASRIMVTAGTEESADYLAGTLRIPREHIIRYPGKSELELLDEVRARNGEKYVQAAFDFVGGLMKRLCFAAVDVDGHVVSIVEESPSFDLNLWDENTSPLMTRSASFHFVQLAARVTHGARASWSAYGRDLAALSDMFDADELRIMPIRDFGPFSLDAVQRAHTAMEQRLGNEKTVATVG